MKNLLLWLVFFGTATCGFTQSKPVDTLKINQLTAYALQEDVRSILNLLDTVSPARLTQTVQLVKEKYLQRFVKKVDTAGPAHASSFVKAVLRVYHQYWNSILLKEQPIPFADSSLKADLNSLLAQGRVSYTNLPAFTSDSPWKALSFLLAQDQYFSNPDGKTGNLFDLFIWSRQDTTVYTVKLPQGLITVPVYFIKDIVTLGWIEYACVENARPGGWPKNGALYCVLQSYDTTSEKFKVSYLQHEAQHFRDKQRYGELPSWRLEYRAKLSELASAIVTMPKLLSDFSMMAKNDSTLPHPFGSYQVIKNMSRVVFKSNKNPSLTDWRNVKLKRIHRAAVKLLKADSKLLDAQIRNAHVQQGKKALRRKGERQPLSAAATMTAAPGR